MNCSAVNISALPSLPLAQRSRLPECAAVYFAVSESGEVLYIGRSQQLLNRWQSHHRRRQLEQIGGIHIAWLAVEHPESLSAVESALIARFQPAYNWAAVEANTTVNRNVRMPRILDDWLIEKAKGGGFRSVPEVIIDLVRRAKEAEETEKAA